MSFTADVGWVVAGVVVIAAVSALSRRLRLPASLVLIAVGIAVALLPSAPPLRIDPDVVLVGVLPALLFATAVQTSPIVLKSQADSVIALSFGLVIFSVIAIGLATWWLVGLVVPGMTLAAGLAFGAVLAPTDAVSVSALARSGQLPKKLASLLDSEGLFNDATALVALNTAAAAILASTLNVGAAALSFAVAVSVGLAWGAAVGFLAGYTKNRTRSAALNSVLSFATPYVAYLPAAAVGGSGFLAVAVAGVLLGHIVPSGQSAESRVAERVNWQTVAFILENATFLIIGFQLPSILIRLSASPVVLLNGTAAILGVYTAMTLARFGWVFTATWFYRVGPRWLRGRAWSWQNALATSFAGVRGVVTLAAVFLLPEKTPGVAFLQLAAFVIVVLSLIQGLSLGRLIVALKLPLPDPSQQDTQIRALTAHAQAAALKQLEIAGADLDEPELVEYLRQGALYRRGLAHDERLKRRPDPYLELRIAMLDAERRAVLQARSHKQFDDTAIRSVLKNLDTTETALRGMTLEP